MEILSLGWIFAVLTAYALLARKPLMLAFLASIAAAFLNQPSIILTNGSSIPAFYIVAIGSLIYFGFSIVDQKQVKPELSNKERRLYLAAVALGIFGVISSITLPFIFSGTPVLIPRLGIDDQVVNPGRLDFHLSNLGQAGYLLIGLSFVLFLQRLKPAIPIVVSSGFYIGLALNLIEFALWSFDIFSLRSVFQFDAGLAKTVVAGVERFKGIYSEASFLGTYAVTASAFFLVMALLDKNSKLRVWYFVWSAIAMFLTLRSLSATGAATLLLVLVVLGIVYTNRYFKFSSKPFQTLSPGKTLKAFGLILIGVILVATLVVIIGPILLEKIGSLSQANRDASNWFSLDLFIQTYGLGVGLGSNRPSSFLFMLLSNVGLVGFILFALVIVFSSYNFTHNSYSTAVFTSLITLLVAKVIGESNLSLPLLWLLIGALAAGLSSRIKQGSKGP